MMQVRKPGSLCSGDRTMNKEFIPNDWTEVTEETDVVGARKDKIKTAKNMLDVLEVLFEDLL